jgi:hypothetical protein
MLIGVVAGLVVPLLEAGDGVKVDAPVVIAHADGPAGAVDRNGALAAWREHGCIELARVTATVGKPIELGCGATGAPRAASSGEVTLVVWPSGAEIAGAMVTPDLHVTKLRAHSDRPLTVSAAYDGARFLVASASCTMADFTPIDAAGKPGARHVLHKADGHEMVVAGAAVACEGGSCEAAYMTANGTLPIACEDQLRRPRWNQLAIAPLIAGTVGKLEWADQEKRDSPLMRHGIPREIGGYISRRDVARDAFGALTATTTYKSELWNGRETTTPDVLQIELVPDDAKASHHVPLDVPSETSPTVLSLGGHRFVLLTAARDGVVVRTITIDPAYFTRAQPPIQPVLQGRIVGSKQKPSDQIVIACVDRHPGCGANAHADGTFVLTVEDPLDYRVLAQVHDPALYAFMQYGIGNDYWYAPAQHETQANIQMLPPAEITGTITWPGGKRPIEAPIHEFVDDGPRGKRQLPDQDPLELQFHASAILPGTSTTVPEMYSYPLNKDGTFKLPVAGTGQAILVAETRDHKYGATQWLTTEPGKSQHIVLALKKTATLTVRFKGVPWTYENSVSLPDVICASVERGCMFEHIAPGTELITAATPEWRMVRKIDVAPGENKTIELPFVADLPPGDAGVKVARAIDGITVTAVAPGGPAAGLLAPGDVITTVDGATIGTDLAAALAKLRGAPGSHADITFVRARRSQHVAITRKLGP